MVQTVHIKILSRKTSDSVIIYCIQNNDIQLLVPTVNSHVKREGIEFACDVVSVYHAYTGRVRTVDVAHEHTTRTHVLTPVHGSYRQWLNLVANVQLKDMYTVPKKDYSWFRA